ncbi:MAG TPA: 50S ribosomal protein L25 [Candidatus Limnocylindrales bacterium]|jgi:large subunit ribosomal protein L25
MSTNRPELAAHHRDVTGKKVAALRREGLLPAVVFGHGRASDNVSVDAKAFESLRRHAGPNTLIDLSIDGKQAAPVLVQQIQHHPVTRKPLHLDLYVVKMTEELTVDVQLVSEGESEAVKDRNGTLLHVIEHIRVKALPDHLPQAVRYSIESLSTFDDVIHVSDLELPADVTLLTDPAEVVAKVLPPRVEEVEEPVAAEGEEPAEGAEAPAAEGQDEAAPAEG